VMNNELAFGLQSVHFNTFLRSSSHHQGANMQYSFEKLKLENHGDYKAMKSVDHGTYLSVLPMEELQEQSFALNTLKKMMSFIRNWTLPGWLLSPVIDDLEEHVKFPVVWMSRKQSRETWQFIPEGDNMWTVKSIQFESYMRSDAAQKDVFCVDWVRTHEYWRIVPDRTMVKLQYHLDDMAMLEDTPVSLGTKVVTNNCPENLLHRCGDSKKKFTVSESTTSTRKWSYTHGRSIDIGSSITAGVPEFTSGLSVKESEKTEHTWGRDESETQSWSYDTECIAAPGLRTTCSYQIKKKRIEVPFTITWNTGEITNGIYEDVDFTHGEFTTDNEEIYN
jgi:hypothetical protein